MRNSFRLTAAAAAVVIVGAVPTAASAGPSGHGPSPQVERYAQGEMSGPPNLTVIADGLSNPRHLNFGPDGALYVAEAGTGGTGPCGPGEGGGNDCYGATGAIGKIAGGQLTTAVSGLPSVAGQGGFASGGPSDVVFDGTNLHFTIQDEDIDASGNNPFGSGGMLLGQVVTAAPGSSAAGWKPLANLAAYEAQHNPDGGGGAAFEMGPAIDSDPYALTPYHGGWAVADAAGNDLLWVSSAGAISVLAVFPTQIENLPAGAFGPTPVTGPIQAVPTSVVVGPDGALYVGELAPGLENTARVWRVVPGSAPMIYADGFTSISDLAFDHEGRLLVLEIADGGLGGVGSTPGALIRVEHNGIRTLLASDGLVAPTGLAVGPDDGTYVSNFGIFPGQDPQGPTGEVVRVSQPSGPGGYRLAGTDGTVYSYGVDSPLGATPAHASPIVGIANTPDRQGYWLAAADGSVYSIGDAGFHGSAGGLQLNQPIVGIASTPDGGGYWLVARDGGIFAYGDAAFMGSTGGIKLNAPIVGMASSPTGNGYWLVASDGGVFTFGDAAFVGSAGGIKLNQPIVGMTASADGDGYWLAAGDGGVFTFGDVQFLGSGAGTLPATTSVVAINGTETHAGFRLITSDGGVYTFGTAPFDGSAAGSAPPASITAASL